MGFGTTASGGASTSMGDGTIASGGGATSMGYKTTASGYYSTSMGYATKASGYASTSMGLRTTASGEASNSMGSYTTASGPNSTSMGDNTSAIGYNSTSMGYYTEGKSYSSLAIGRFNDTVAGSSETSWVSSDPLLMVGNGSGYTTRSNAMTVYKNGNTDIQGFTQLGTGAPAIKMKLVNLTSAASEGGSVTQSMGVSTTTILGVQVLLNWTATNWLGPGYTRVSGYEYQYILSGSNITVYNISGNSANILSKPIRVLVTYTE
jgi:hypothetical protein